RDAAGTPKRMIGASIDVTAAKEARQKLAYLAGIVAASDDAIIGVTPAGIIHTWNGGAQRLYGYSPDDVIGRPLKLLAPADREHEVDDFLARMEQGEHSAHLETVQLRNDGSPVDVALTVSPI